MKSLLVLLLLVPLSLFAQNQAINWNFPVKPGSEEWKSLKNNSEKVYACQIPKNVLPNLKTPALLKVCLNYPLLPDIFAFNNIKDDFNKFENDFNGFRELLNRSHVSIELLKYYKTLDPSAIPADATILEKGNYVLSLSFVELFISHPKIMNRIGLTEKKEIVKELLSKKEKKSRRPDWYKNTGIQTSYLAIINLIQNDIDKIELNIDMKNIESYVYTGKTLPVEIEEQINQAVNKYLKTH